MKSLLDWVDSRTGLVKLTNDFLTEDVPGGPSYWYVFGSATLFAMILQIATGIFLTFYYAPSSASAWESTLFIYQKVPLGQFIISLHYWGATAMIALVAMHLLQTAIWGAYKKPRELQWVVGLVLFVLTLVLGLTGYLLPWDLNAYFASQVSLNITGAAPIAGPFLQNWLQGGPTMGTLTINKFFGIHVWLTPLILIGLVVVHLIIFRHNGAAGPPVDTRPQLKPGRFWPNQMFMDTIASFIVLAVHRVAGAGFTGAARRQGRPEQRPVRPIAGLVFHGPLLHARNIPRPIRAVTRDDRHPDLGAGHPDPAPVAGSQPEPADQPPPDRG